MESHARSFYTQVCYGTFNPDRLYHTKHVYFLLFAEIVEGYCIVY